MSESIESGRREPGLSGTSGSAASVLRRVFADVTPERLAEIKQQADDIVERAEIETRRCIADLEAHRGAGPKESLTSDQLRAAIIEAVNDGDSADAIHYALRWRRQQNTKLPGA